MDRAHTTTTQLGTVAVLAITVCVTQIVGRGAEPQDAARSAQFQAEVLPVLRELCFECHGPDTQEAGIGLNKYSDLVAIRKDYRHWQKIGRAISFGQMPPADAPQPSPEQRRLVAGWVQGVLNDLDCSESHDPGRVTIRRLNRSEYDNTIRDLLGVDLRPARDFPADDVGEGFDNIGDVLSLPPLLFEKYLDAAEQVAAAAIVADPVSLARRQLRQKEDLRFEGVGAANEDGIFAMYSEAAVRTDVEFSRDGEYLLRVEAGADQAGPDKARIEFRVDGKAVGTVDVAAPRDFHAWYEVRTKVGHGRRVLTAAFVNDFFAPDDPDPARRDRNAYVNALEVVGPLDLGPADYPASHKRLVTTRPSKKLQLEQAAQRVLTPIVQRAFRRPAKPEEVTPFVQLVTRAATAGDSYERGLQAALTAILVSPSFLFRVESDPREEKAGSQALSDFELASRLSYFLWSSMPDDELFKLAARGQLHKPDILDQQARRMLADPKSAALAENFAGQWLNLRLLDNHTPDPTQFQSFDAQLRADMKEETLRFFQAVVHEDRSVLDFLNADFTFVTERLAKHYGLSGYKGDGFQRVTLSGGQRAGLLTQASILTLTSNPARTSPVKRGKWILENILGTPPPPPPPNVPQLAATQKVAPDLPLRKQLEMHRQNPACAVCHREMDTLGLGFENFDAVGRWRDVDGAQPVDAAGVLPDGRQFTGPVELVRLLKNEPGQFTQALSEKLLTYALGRGLEFYDRCAVDKIKVSLEQNDYRFSVLVTQIVQSEPFLRRRSDEP